MISLSSTEGKRIVLLEQHDIDRLRGGHVVTDGATPPILIYFMRDARFVSDKIQDALALAPMTAETLVGIVEEDRKRGLREGSNWKQAGAQAASDVAPPDPNSGSAGG